MHWPEAQFNGIETRYCYCQQNDIIVSANDIIGSELFPFQSSASSQIWDT